jgi:hypothetical protein
MMPVPRKAIDATVTAALRLVLVRTPAADG